MSLPEKGAETGGGLAYNFYPTTGGHRVYLDAVENEFGANFDYATLLKIYGNDSEPKTCYRPEQCNR